jgi:hypothetical protein
MDLDGWHPDPFRVHEERLFKQGQPTPLVRDGGVGSYDQPPTSLTTVAGSAKTESQVETLIPATKMASMPPPIATSPGVGWWVASDGNWYAPELHPNYVPPPPPPLPVAAPPPMPSQQMASIQPEAMSTAPATPFAATNQFGGQPAPDTRLSSRKRTVVIIAALIALVALTAGATIVIARHGNTGGHAATRSGATQQTSIPASPRIHTIAGTLDVVTQALFGLPAGASCYVPTAYGGEMNGDQVTVTDGSGSTLGVGTLTNGTVTGPGATICEFSFTVSDVPDSSFYGVTVDGHSGPQYSKGQLQSANWAMSLSLNG